MRLARILAGQDAGMRGERRIRVLIAEGTQQTRDELRRVIEKDDGFEICAEAADGELFAALRAGRGRGGAARARPRSGN